MPPLLPFHLHTYQVATIILLPPLICSVYFQTLYPSVSPGDSGELIAAAFTRSVPHPPGYPSFSFLYSLALEGYSWYSDFNVPFEDRWNPAFVANVLTAGLASVNASLVCLLGAALAFTFRDTASQMGCPTLTAAEFLPPVTFAVYYAFSAGIWEYSLQPEVFTLVSGAGRRARCA